jgi:hypothetical protein
MLFYLAKVLLTLIIFLVLFNLLNIKYKHTNYYKNIIADNKKFLNLKEQYFEIVNLGSSQAKFAFDYDGSCYHGMNWAIDPQSFDYDFRILKQYHSCLCKNAFVLIPISPFSFLFRNTLDEINYLKYYLFLDHSLIHNYSTKKLFLHIKYPILGAKRNILHLIKDITPDDRLNIFINPMDDKEFSRNAKIRIEELKKRYLLDDLNNIVLSSVNKNNIEYNIAILRDIIAFCIEHEYRPVISVLPVASAMGLYIPKSFVDTYILGNIKESNDRNVPVLNYWNDEKFVSNDLYLSPIFFNLTGRKSFTKRVLQDLETLF